MFGCDAVAISHICILGREWLGWFCQKVGVEVEAICCEGVDGYATGDIDAFTTRCGG